MTQLASHPAVAAGDGLIDRASGEKRLFGRTAAFCVSAFLLLGFSRMTDMLFPGPPFVLALSLIALALTILNGSIGSALGSRVGVRLMLFAAWICLAAPFGAWPGGSVQIIKEELLRSVMAFVIVAAALRTVEQCRLAMFMSGAGVVIAALFAFQNDARVLGRLVLPIGAYSNPNDFASALLLGVPLLWCLAASDGKVALWKLALLLSGSSALLYAISMTGSRGALVALLVIVVTFFAMARFSLRVVIALGAMVALILAPLWLPDSVAIRLGLDVEEPTYGADSALAKEQLAAEGSADERVELLRQSLLITFKNPILGVGAGNFEVVAAEMSKTRGERAIWRGTHNTYTQISSEGGIPALLFYVGALIVAVRNVVAVRRRSITGAGQAKLARLATALLLSLISLAVTSFFGSVGYHWLLPVLAGFTVALSGAAAREMPDNPAEA